MSATLKLDARLAITDSIHAFFHLVDSGRASQTVRLFTSNAKLTFGPGSPQPGTIEGSAIAQTMMAREELKTAFTRHCISNIFLTAAGEDVAAHYLMVIYRSDDDSRSSAPAFVADVDEVWVLENGEWKIGLRTLTPTFFRG